MRAANSLLPPLLLVFFITSSSFATTAYEYIDNDARNVAMGGATVATVRDYFALEINPALLADSHTPSFNISGDVIEYVRESDEEYTGISKRTRSYLQDFGGVYPTNVFGKKTTFAVGYNRQIIPYEMRFRKLDYPWYYTEGTYLFSNSLWTVSGGLGVQLSQGLSLGIASHIWGGSSEISIGSRGSWGYSNWWYDVKNSGIEMQFALAADISKMNSSIPVQIGFSLSPPFKHVESADPSHPVPDSDGDEDWDDSAYLSNITIKNENPLRIDMGIAFNLPFEILIESDITYIGIGESKWVSLRDPDIEKDLSVYGDNIIRLAFGAEKVISNGNSDFAFRAGYFHQNTGEADQYGIRPSEDNFYSYTYVYGDRVKRSGFSFGMGFLGKNTRIDLAYASVSEDIFVSLKDLDPEFARESEINTIAGENIFTCSMTYYLKSIRKGNE